MWSLKPVGLSSQVVSQARWSLKPGGTSRQGPLYYIQYPHWSNKFCQAILFQWMMMNSFLYKNHKQEQMFPGKNGWQKHAYSHKDFVFIDKSTLSHTSLKSLKILSIICVWFGTKYIANEWLNITISAPDSCSFR